MVSWKIDDNYNCFIWSICSESYRYVYILFLVQLLMLIITFSERGVDIDICDFETNCIEQILLNIVDFK